MRNGSFGLLIFLLLGLLLGIAAAHAGEDSCMLATYYSRGLALDKAGRHDRAIEEYSLAIAADPGNAAAYYRRGLDYGRKGHFDRETEDYSKAAALDPEIGRPGRGGERWTDAEVEAFTRAIAGSPDDAWAYYGRGISLRLKGRPEEAAADFRKALSLDPGNSAAAYHLGASLRTLGRLGEAVHLYDRILAADPAIPWAAYNRGLLLSRQGRYAEAIEDLGRTLEADPNYASPAQQYPNYAWAYYDLGYARLKLLQYERAIADFTRAVTAAPEFPPLYYWRATAYSAIGEAEKARQDMRRAARLGSAAAKQWLKSP